MCAEHPRNGLSVAVERHLEALLLRKYSPKSIAIYRHGLGCFTAYLESRGIERFQDVAPADLEAFRVHLNRDKGFAPATLEQALRAMRQLFRWLETEQELFVNPAEHFLIPQPKRTLLPVPSEEDMRRLLAAPDLARPIGVRDRALMETLYSTGLRLQELQELNVPDPDLQQQRLRIMGKGRKERVVPLGRQAVHWLRQYISAARPKLLKEKIDEPALWIGLRGGRLGAIPRPALLDALHTVKGTDGDRWCHLTYRALVQLVSN